MTNPPSSSSSSSSESSSSGSDESQTDYEVPAVRPTDEVPHFTKKGLVRGYVEGWNVPESSLKAIEDAAALELQGKGLHKFSEIYPSTRGSAGWKTDAALVKFFNHLEHFFNKRRTVDWLETYCPLAIIGDRIAIHNYDGFKQSVRTDKATYQHDFRIRMEPVVCHVIGKEVRDPGLSWPQHAIQWGETTTQRQRLDRFLAWVKSHPYAKIMWLWEMSELFRYLNLAWVYFGKATGEEEKLQKKWRVFFEIDTAHTLALLYEAKFMSRYNHAKEDGTKCGEFFTALKESPSGKYKA
ncbi:hypothetical protein MMC10_000446 [Thelotrema lepadinum]|nr:hypothetical protein [Thelotrema lepadinum]